MQRTVGPTGIPRLNAEREGGSHADRFWALALAVSVADGGPGEYRYLPVRPTAPVAGADFLRSQRPLEIAATRQPQTGRLPLRGRVGGLY